MKKVLGIFAVLAAVVVVALLFMTPSFNKLALERQKVERSYAEVQIVLQRQADLLPNMAEIAKGYAKHEENTFKEVAEARAGLTAAAALKPADLATNPEAQKQFAAAIAAQSAAMVKLQSVVEAYPALQANENFKTLMVEVEGSQNRITIARRKNQDAVTAFNKMIVIYPEKAIGAVAGYHELPFFKADDTAQKAPTLKF